MRALVISDMAAGPDAPGRGVFVRDQVAALRRLPGLDVELDEAPPGAGALAALALRSARRPGPAPPPRRRPRRGAPRRGRARRAPPAQRPPPRLRRRPRPLRADRLA